MGVKVDGCENVDEHDEAMIMIRTSPESVLKGWVSEANPTP